MSIIYTVFQYCFRNIVWVGIFFVSYTCTDKSNDEIKYEFSLVDSLKLPALSSIPIKTLCVRYLNQDNKEYLFWANYPNNSIEIFELTSQSHKKTISIPENGPYGISTLKGGFTVINFDTIFINDISTVGKLYCIDTSGYFYDVINYINDTSMFNLNNSIALNSHINVSVFKSHDELIIPLRIPYFKIKPSLFAIEKINKFNIYNFSTRTLSTSSIRVDPEIFNELGMNNLSSGVSVGNRYYYQHQNSANIYYTDDLIQTQKKVIVSKYFDGFTTLNAYPSPFESLKFSFYYYSMQSDPFKHLLYRINKLPASDPLHVDGYDEFNYRWNLASIMVLDMDLNLLEEYLFLTYGRYSWKECFVGEKGFYLKRSPNHPHYSENKITFDIFEFKLMQDDTKL